MSVRHITANVPFRLESTDGGTVVIPGELGYSAQDPYAVRLVVNDPRGPVQWNFGRALLAAGLTGTAGDGDVRIWPSEDETDVLCILLSSPSGSAVLRLPVPPVRRFLEASFDIVPTGSETSHIDFDAELDALLNED